MPSLEQIESDYRIQFPEDFLILRSRLEQSGALTLTDEYTLLQPDEIVQRKPKVLWPELIPVIQNRYDGCAICLRAPLIEGEGYFWDWFDGEEGQLGSLGRDFSAVLRTVLIDIFRSSFEEKDPTRASALVEQSYRLLSLPGIVSIDRIPLMKEFMSYNEVTSAETLRTVSGAQAVVPVWGLAEVDFYRNSCHSKKALTLCDKLLEIDPRFLNVHWCLGALYALRGRQQQTTMHFAAVAEGEWGRIWPAHCMGKGFWHPDLAVVAEFLMQNLKIYRKASHSPIIGEIFASGAAAEGVAWERALERAIGTGNWMTARIIALNGMIDSHWPPGRWPKGHVRRCAEALVLACEKLGFAGRVEGLLELWLTSPEVE